MRSVANLTRRDGEEFLALAPQVPVRTEIEVFPLEQANEALDRLRAGEIRGAAVLQIYGPAYDRPPAVRAVLRVPPLPAVAAFTPDAERVYFASNISGQFNLWSALSTAGWPHQLTSFTREHGARRLRARRRRAAPQADRDGDEFHQLYRIPAGGGWPRAADRSAAGAARDRRRRLVAGRTARSRSAPTRRRAGDFEVWVQDADGTTSRARSSAKGCTRSRRRVSPDGSKLLTIESAPTRLVDLSCSTSSRATPPS